jgi:hypothetical protein
MILHFFKCVRLAQRELWHMIELYYHSFLF